MAEPIPVRLSNQGRTATWNPAVTRAASVVLQVRNADGSMQERTSLNSGRARVRETERIESVVPAED
ncbi:hypothetical protein BH23GEM8_BH23GEM8_07730 [soil metagenome]